jgi:hypothetical protein
MNTNLILTVSTVVLFVTIVLYNYHLRQLIRTHELTIEYKFHIISALQDYISKLEYKNSDLNDEINLLKSQKNPTRRKVKNNVA